MNNGAATVEQRGERAGRWAIVRRGGALALTYLIARFASALVLYPRRVVDAVPPWHARESPRCV